MVVDYLHIMCLACVHCNIELCECVHLSCVVLHACGVCWIVCHIWCYCVCCDCVKLRDIMCYVHCLCLWCAE